MLVFFRICFKLFIDMETPEKQIAPWFNRMSLSTCTLSCSTLLLMNAKIMDETVTNTIACSIHSTALIGYINLLEEKYHMSYHQPVNRLTNRLGITKWIVELRHEASHSTFPSLTELQEVTNFALKWIKTHTTGRHNYSNNMSQPPTR